MIAHVLRADVLGQQRGQQHVATFGADGQFDAGKRSGRTRGMVQGHRQVSSSSVRPLFRTRVDHTSTLRRERGTRMKLS